jgi:hypothetical protein
MFDATILAKAQNVKRGNDVYAEAFTAYRGLFLGYHHQVVNDGVETAYKELTGYGERRQNDVSAPATKVADSGEKGTLDRFRASRGTGWVSQNSAVRKSRKMGAGSRLRQGRPESRERRRGTKASQRRQCTG